MALITTPSLQPLSESEVRAFAEKFDLYCRGLPHRERNLLVEILARAAAPGSESRYAAARSLPALAVQPSLQDRTSIPGFIVTFNQQLRAAKDQGASRVTFPGFCRSEKAA